MTEYLVPTAEGQAELTEKRSRFIGRVRPVETEEEARAFLEEVRRLHRDARHNCWCYLLKDGTVRASDDGEPQGTAGQPMLELFQRERLTNLCCVVTRYFGGVLLGTGGLLRAYTGAAREALDAAGVSVVRRWTAAEVSCPYSLYERLKLEAESLGGAVEDTEFTAAVRLLVLLPEGREEDFSARVTELTSGTCEASVLGEQFRAVPLER